MNHIGTIQSKEVSAKRIFIQKLEQEVRDIILATAGNYHALRFATKVHIVIKMFSTIEPTAGY